MTDKSNESSTPTQLDLPVKWPDGSHARFLSQAAKDPNLASPELRFRAEFAGYGDRLRSRRKERGLTQKELAAITELTQARISSIENGKMDDGPTLKTMSRLAHALGAEDLNLSQTDAPQTPPVRVMADVEFLNQPTAAVRKVFARVKELRTQIGMSTCYVPQHLVTVSSKQGGGFEVNAVKADADPVKWFPDYVEIAGMAESVSAASAKLDKAAGVSYLNKTANYIVPSADPNAPPTTVNVLKDFEA